MPIEVPCPNCKSVLRAPDDAAGRRVKCKKCEHRFHLPGGPPLPAGVGDSQSLSVVDPPANPFAFEPPGGAVVVPPGRAAKPPADREPEAPRRPAKSGGGSGKVLLIVGLVVGLFCLTGLGGLAAVVYYLYSKSAEVIRTMPTARVSTEPPVTKPPGPPAPTEPAPAPPPEPPKDLEPVKPADQPGPAPTTPAPTTPPTPPVAARAARAFKLPVPPKTKPAVIAKPKDRLTLELPASAVRRVRFAYGNPPVVAVLWASRLPFQGAGGRDAVDLYGLQTGKRADRVEFPSDGFPPDRPRLFELSPDGNRIAIEQPAGRLTVYDFETKSRLADGADPFAGSPGLSGPPVALRFVNPETVAVFDRDGGLVLWNLASKERTTAGPPAGPSAAVSRLVGDRFFVAARGTLTTVGLKDGRPIGTPIHLPQADWLPLAVAADPLGKRVAVVYRPAGAGLGAAGLIVLDLGGKPATVVPLPAEAGEPVGVGFVGSDAVVAVLTDQRAGCVLYDLENDTPSGYLRARSGRAAQFLDDVAGRHWWAVPDPGNANHSLLVGVEMPFDDYFKLVTQAKGTRTPAYLTLGTDGLSK